MDPYTSSDVFLFDKYRFDRSGGGLFRENEEGGLVWVALGARALDILALLLRRPGELVTKEEIFGAVWPNTVVESSNLTVQIAALRRVLDQGRSSGSFIQTVSGHGYRFVAPVSRQLSGRRLGQIPETENSERPIPRMSVIVLPLLSLSDDPKHENCVDAITDDLTADLSRIADSFVIARTTAFAYKGNSVDVRQVSRELGVRYVIEGSVRCVHECIHVNVQLLDGKTGSHVWADHFDIDGRHTSETQNEIVGRLANTIKFELLREIGRQIEQEHSDDYDTLDIVLRAQALRVENSAADIRARRAMVDRLECALAREPASVDVQIQIAAILVSDVADGFSASVERDEERAEGLITEALERDPNRSESHRIMGQLRRLQGRWAESQAQLETAIALDPNNSTALRQLGITLRSQGRPEVAIPYLEKSIRFEARHRYLFNGYTNLANCHLYLDHIDDAVDLYRRAQTLAPEIWYVHLCLAAALALRGDIEEAKGEIAEAAKLKPEVGSIASWRAILATQGFDHPKLLAMRERTAFAGLRRAGFPEQ